MILWLWWNMEPEIVIVEAPTFLDKILAAWYDLYTQEHRSIVLLFIQALMLLCMAGV